jgi:hypothetical protein
MRQAATSRLTSEQSELLLSFEGVLRDEVRGARGVQSLQKVVDELNWQIEGEEVARRGLWW